MASTRRVFLNALIGLAGAGAARAGTGTLPPASGKPILTISGKISVCNAADKAEFDRDLLESLGTSTLVTSTPWHDGQVRFEGVLMTRLMATVGATGDTVIATALNDYETRIPVADFAEFGVLLALKRDGAYMPVRDKGPLFIVYPFDSNPALRTQKFYSRSAWQLSRLVVK
ncbi:MAG: molybdopterin-dependent oxidoreductase [Acetobacteraceae bacterium]